MEIVFFNLCSIGDIFFTIPFLKHLCKHNPTKQFFFFTRFASALQQGIPNLIPINKENYPIDHPENQRLYNFFHQYDRKRITVLSEKKILFNTWVHPFNELIAPLNAECFPQNLALAYKRLIEELNQGLSARLEFPLPTKQELLYEMPPISLSLWNEFRKTAPRTLFYWNRMGATARTKPFTTEAEQQYILEKLSMLLPDYTIIVPNEHILPPCANIVPTSRFGVKEDTTCHNVLEDITIAGQCTVAVIFDIGSCYTMCNNMFANYTATFLHLSKEDEFYEKLKKTLQYALEVPCENYKYLECGTSDQAVEVIMSYLKTYIH